MALINSLKHINVNPAFKTTVSGDYSFNEKLFQIRTYKDGDTRMTEGHKQNIQLTKDMASELIRLLEQFTKQ